MTWHDKNQGVQPSGLEKTESGTALKFQTQKQNKSG